MPTLAGNKQLFHPSLPSQDASFPSFDRKGTDLVRQRWISKCLFPRRHIAYKRIKVYSIIGTNEHFPNWEYEKIYIVTVASMEN